jgi:hypothetical protein
MLLIHCEQEALEVMRAPCVRLCAANHDRCRLLTYRLCHLGDVEGFEMGLSPAGGSTR